MESPLPYKVAGISVSCRQYDFSLHWSDYIATNNLAFFLGKLMF